MMMKRRQKLKAKARMVQIKQRMAIDAIRRKAESGGTVPLAPENAGDTTLGEIQLLTANQCAGSSTEPPKASHPGLTKLLMEPDNKECADCDSGSE